MIEFLWKYYGADWLAMITSFLYIYYVGNKKRFGFIFGIIANLSWMAFGIMTASLANLIANTILIILNIRGYIKWGKIKNDRPANPPSD